VFTPTQLMFIADAVENYSNHPVLRENDVVQLHLDGITDVVIAQLAKMGYRYEGSEVYTVK